ncbi:fibronectin type III and SPRY domain-containing protein 2-like [Perognathus longimembris pacificus]|uniref:fibronectin type III and SPRY domain-containing protein 2-like n=1 Tax=Perognathus longimembris pacificus TaxID=214514 RepID=UPI002019E1CD|nr:fibronectin type III and SPRY domain-containing protein 2-like [Perognathus longimembris pacificus]
MADRLGKFLKTKTDVEIFTQPDFEDQTLDFTEVEQLMGALNTVPGGDSQLCPQGWGWGGKGALTLDLSSNISYSA